MDDELVTVPRGYVDDMQKTLDRLTLENAGLQADLANTRTFLGIAVRRFPGKSMTVTAEQMRMIEHNAPVNIEVEEHPSGTITRVSYGHMKEST